MAEITAMIFGCSLKPSSIASSTEKLSGELADVLRRHGVFVEHVRVSDYNIAPGTAVDMGEGDEWPRLRTHMLSTDIVIIATPTWAGQPSSIAQRIIERLDAELAEVDSNGLPLVYGKVGGAVVVGNEDGAHHICAVVFQALNDFGFTIPANAATYWNGEAMNKIDYLDLEKVPEAVALTTKQMAKNLIHTATLLRQEPYIVA